MADEPNYLLQLGDQCMNMAGKFDKLIPMIQDVVTKQQDLTNINASLIGVTTAVELATALALVMAATSLYLTIKWRIDDKAHNQPLPRVAALPKPRHWAKITDEEVDELLKHIKPKPQDRPIDTLAELAQELNGRNK